MLADIYSEYESDDRLKKLRKAGIKFVPGEGPLNPDLMLVGEAPGSMENAQGKPFIGPAGVILNKLLESICLKRDDIFITNAVKYYPTTEEGDKRSPSPAELAISRDYLLREISAVNPQIIGLCGYAAIACIYPTVQSVNEVHYELLDNRFVPLYHPATIGYRPELKGKVTKGYKMLQEYIQQKVNSVGR